MMFKERSQRVPIDGLALLQRDHIRVLLLVQKLRVLPFEEPDRDAALLQLSRELAVHANLEEKVLYVELRDGVATRAKVLGALKYHERIHELLFDLAVMAPDETAWHKAVAQLAEVVARYVEYEEAEIFPIGRHLMTPMRRRRMTRELLTEQRRLTRIVGPSAYPGFG